MKNQITAYNVRAKVEGKSWLTMGTTLTAPNEEEARNKAIKLLNLTPEHIITIETVTVHNIETVLSNDNYPYGYKKTTAFYSVEYNTKKGCRSVFQTIDPKTGRKNNPKKSTYSPVILPMTDSVNHFHGCGYIDFNGSEQMNRGFQFMADFYEMFTVDQIKDIALYALMMSKVNAKAMVIYAGSKWEDVKPLVEDSIKKLNEIAKEGTNLWEQCAVNVQAIEATKQPGYNPFKTSEVIAL